MSATGTWSEEREKSTVISSPATSTSTATLIGPHSVAALVEPVLEAVAAVGDRADQLAHALLGAVEDLVDGAVDQIEAVLLVELGHALGADEVGVALGRQVAAQDLRQAHVAENQPQHVLVELAAAHDAHGQDAQALLEALGDALHALRAGRRAADVDVMRGVDEVADLLRRRGTPG